MTRIEIIKDGSNWFIISPDGVDEFPSEWISVERPSLPLSLEERLVELLK